MDEDDVSDDSFYSLYRSYGWDVYGMEIRYIRHGRRYAEPNCRTVSYSAEELVPDDMAYASSDHCLHSMG